MPKKRKPFRFRIPFFSSSSASRPVTRPKDESKLHEHAETSIPIQGSPRKAPARSPTQAQEIPISDHQQHSPSHPLQPEKLLSVTNGSSGPPQSTSESLASMSSSPTTQPQSPAHLALERTSEESRPSAIEGTSLATSPSQQEKEGMVVSEREPKPEMSPLKTIPKAQELAQPKIPSHVSEPIPESQDLTPLETSSHVSKPQGMAVSEQEPQPEMSPLKTIPKSDELTQPKIPSQVSEPIPVSQDLTQLEISSHASEPVPQSKESPVKTIPKSQEITEPKTSPSVLEPMPQAKDSPLKSIPRSQELPQLEPSLQVSQPMPQPMDSSLKSTADSQELTQQESSSPVSEPESQSKKSPLTPILKSQESTQLDTSSHVSEPMPQLKESPLKTSPKSEELTRLEIPSHEFVPEPQVKESPLKTSPKYKEVLQLETTSHVSEPMPQPKKSPLKIISEPQEPIQPKTSPQPERMPSKREIMLSKEEGSTTPKTPPKEKKFELDSDKEKSKTILEIKSKFHQKEENEKVVHETTDPSSIVVGAERERQDTEKSTKSKVMSASDSTGKDIEVVSSILPMSKKVPRPSHEKDVSSIEAKTPLKKGIKEDISKFVQKLAMGQSEDPMEDKPVSAITLAGENKGATMQLGSGSTMKEGSVQVNRAYRTSPQESPEVTTESDREEGPTSSVEPDEVGNAYVNSNIQGINNSLMYQGSITEKDPGVQLILPQKPPEFIKSDDEDSKG